MLDRAAFFPIGKLLFRDSGRGGLDFVKHLRAGRVEIEMHAAHAIVLKSEVLAGLKADVRLGEFLVDLLPGFLPMPFRDEAADGFDRCTASGGQGNSEQKKDWSQ